MRYDTSKGTLHRFMAPTQGRLQCPEGDVHATGATVDLRWSRDCGEADAHYACHLGRIGWLGWSGAPEGCVDDVLVEFLLSGVGLRVDFT